MDTAKRPVARWGAHQSGHIKWERGRTDATIGNLQLVGFEVGGLVVGTRNREGRCPADDGGEILQCSFTISSLASLYPTRNGNQAYLNAFTPSRWR